MKKEKLRLGKFKKKRKKREKKREKNDGLNPQWGWGFRSESTFHIFVLTFNVKKYV